MFNYIMSFLPFGRRAKFERGLQDIKVGVLRQTIGFAAEVAEKIDKLVAQKAFGLSNKTPSYARQFSVGAPKTPTTHVNQILLFVEALSFFWHAIDRLSFRPNSEALRAAVLDPLVHSFTEMLAEVLNKGGMSTTEADSLLGVQSLSLRYAEAPTLLGASAHDTNCALWLAANAIAKDVDLDEALAFLIRLRLSEGLLALDLANRIKDLEAAL